MSKQLQDAVKEASSLPEPDQVDLAEIMHAFIAARTADPLPLTPTEEAAIDEGLVQAGRGEFISDAAVSDLLRRSWA